MQGGIHKLHHKIRGEGGSQKLKNIEQPIFMKNDYVTKSEKRVNNL
jgi:hypothetical protein